MLSPARAELPIDCIALETLDGSTVDLASLMHTIPGVTVRCSGAGSVPAGQDLPLVDVQSFLNVPLVDVVGREVVVGDPTANRILCNSSHPSWDWRVRTCRVTAGMPNPPNVYSMGAYGTYASIARVPIQSTTDLTIQGGRIAPWYLRRAGRPVESFTIVTASGGSRVLIPTGKSRGAFYRYDPFGKAVSVDHCRNFNHGAGVWKSVPFDVVDKVAAAKHALATRHCLDFRRIPQRSDVYVQNIIRGAKGSLWVRTASAKGAFDPFPPGMNVMSDGSSIDVSQVQVTGGQGTACWEVTEAGSGPENMTIPLFPSWQSNGTRPGSPLEGTGFASYRTLPIQNVGGYPYRQFPPGGPAFGPRQTPAAGSSVRYPFYTAQSCSGQPPSISFGGDFEQFSTLLFNVEREGNQAPVTNIPVESINGTADLSLTVDADSSPSPIGPQQTPNWLQAELNQTETPASIRVELETDGLAVGEYTGTITVSSPQSAPITMSVVLRIREPRPYFEDVALLNAAGQQPGAVAPGMAFVIFGAHFGPDPIQTLMLGADGRVTPDLGGIRVLFDGDTAPMIFSFNGQISGFTPYSVAGKETVDVEIEWLGELSRAMTIPVLDTAPGFFTLDQTGGGQAAALNSDFSVNTPETPIAVGDIVQFFGTGPGQTNPPGIDGQIVGAPLPALLAETMVWIDDMPAEVVYSGPAPGLADGVWQVNARVGAGVRPGDRVPVRAKVGENWTQPGTTIAVKPRDE